MSLVTTKWAFRNNYKKTTTPIIIQAIDGPTAWKKFALTHGIENLSGNMVMPMCHDWYIHCVCICGKTQNESFCSESCFQAWKGSV